MVFAAAVDQRLNSYPDGSAQAGGVCPACFVFFWRMNAFRGRKRMRGGGEGGLLLEDFNVHCLRAGFFGACWRIAYPYIPVTEVAVPVQEVFRGRAPGEK